MRIFFMSGAGIGVFGSILGLVLGVLFCTYIQQIQAFVEWVTADPGVQPGRLFPLPHPGQDQLGPR